MRRRGRPTAAAGLPLLLALASIACSDGRSATDPGALYACSTTADCLTGYSCVCNLCQRPGAAGICADAAGTDATAPDAASPDTVSPDTVAPDVADTGDAVAALDAADGADAQDAADVYAGPCNLYAWTPCSPGQGCYYAPATKQTACHPHGSLGLGAACDPAQPTLCGKAKVEGKERPLVCDTVDLKCYPTCQCSQPSALGCPAGQTCYCLKDGADFWPDGAGICAP